MASKYYGACQKWALVILIYTMLVNFISYMINYKGNVMFIPKEEQLGNKYVFMYLKSGAVGAFSDSEAASVFNVRKCGYCAITNDRGFIPMSEYDAVLIHSEIYAMEDTSEATEKEKTYLLDASHECLVNKLGTCEPTITSFTTNMNYKLCELCNYLLNKK